MSLSNYKLTKAVGCIVSEYESAMKEAQKKFETYWCDAAHAFANTLNKLYSKEFADEASKKAFVFLKKSQGLE